MKDVLEKDNNWSVNLKLEEAAEMEKQEKIERMKQGPAENMTTAVLKQLLKNKAIRFNFKAKKSELVNLLKTVNACTGSTTQNNIGTYNARARKVTVSASIPMRLNTAERLMTVAFRS